MRSFRHLVFALMAALALITSQAVTVLHGLAHDHHHADAAHVELVVEHDHHANAAESEDADDHEFLHCAVCARLSTAQAQVPVNAPVAVLVVNVATEPNEPPRDVTQPIPRLYVTAPPDQPRAPPVS